jgi:rhamnose transport system ATP-binding protein
MTTTASGTTLDTLVSVQGIDKSYGGVPVLKSVSIDFARGSIHGLVGENGAGKSTLTKIMAGIVPADGGAIVVDGTSVHFRSPHAALAHGITMITQELSLVPQRSVLENVFLGRLNSSFGFVREGDTLKRFLEVREKVGFSELDPRTPVGMLPTARQQEVEILRAVSSGARMIIMDEPTASLSSHETKQLLDLIRRLAAEGTTIVLISHFLEEVLSVADTVSVLRDGVLISTGPAHAHTPHTLVQQMVGRPVDVLYPEPAPVAPDAPVVLRATGLKRGRMVRGVDIEVRRGEIVGLAGLIGAGRSETARLIFGADALEAGTVEVNGKKVRPGSPDAAMAAGMAMVPESRKEQGLILVRSIRENISLASLGSVSTAGFVNPAAENRTTGDLSEKTDIRGGTPETPIWALSGGNQQKALFAKWLMRKPTLLIVDEPTRGIDVGAKVQVHRLLRDLAAEGMALLVISSEIEEVMGLAHRICVMRRGRIVARYERGQASREELLKAAFAEAVEEEAG